MATVRALRRVTGARVLPPPGVAVMPPSRRVHAGTHPAARVSVEPTPYHPGASRRCRRGSIAVPSWFHRGAVVVPSWCRRLAAYGPMHPWCFLRGSISHRGAVIGAAGTTGALVHMHPCAVPLLSRSRPAPVPLLSHQHRADALEALPSRTGSPTPGGLPLAKQPDAAPDWPANRLPAIRQPSRPCCPSATPRRPWRKFRRA